MAKFAHAGIGGQRDGSLCEDRARVGERSFVVLPKSPAGRINKVVCDLISLNIQHEGLPATGMAETFQNVDIKRELNSIMELWLLIAIAMSAQFAPAALNVSWYITAILSSQQIRLTKQ